MLTEDLARQNTAFLCKELVKTVEDMKDFSSESMALSTAIDSIIFDNDTSDEAMIILERALTLFMDRVFKLYGNNPQSRFLNSLQQRVDSLIQNVRNMLD